MCPVGAGIHRRVCSVFLCLKNTLQSHFCTRSVELHQGCWELGLLLCCARLRAWDGSAASHIPPGEGKMPAGSREAGQQGRRPPASLQRAALQWVVGYTRMARGLVTAGAQPRSSGKAGLAFGISASIPSQRQQLGWHAAELRGSRRPRAGADPAALLIAPGLPASCVMGLGRVGAGAAGGAGGLWSSSSSQHLGDGGWGTWQPEGPSPGMAVGCFPLARWGDGLVAPADAGRWRLLPHGLCSEEPGVFCFPGSLLLSRAGSNRINA